jgi:hypothetical protein
MKKVFLLVVFVFVFSFANAQSSKTLWLLGPMFHFNIGKQFEFSMGLEVSAWGDFGSVDFGVDVYNKNRFFIYSEYQRTIGASVDSRFLFIYGASLGPCLEIRNDSLSYVHLGVQGSGWIAFLPSVDMRVRLMKDEVTYSPGLFFKIPVGYRSESWH